MQHYVVAYGTLYGTNQEILLSFKSERIQRRPDGVPRHAGRVKLTTQLRIRKLAVERIIKNYDDLDYN